MNLSRQDPSDEFPEDELAILESEQTDKEKKTIPFMQVWNKILHFGLGESTLRIGTAAASIILVVLVIWVMSKFFLTAEKTTAPVPVATDQAVAAPLLPVGEEVNPSLISSISVIRDRKSVV